MAERKYLKPLEILVLFTIIGSINAFFENDPGFASMYYIPYLVASVLVSTIYGAGWGFLAFGVSASVIAGALPVALGMIHADWSTSGYWKNLADAYIPASVGLLLIYVFGVIRSTSVTATAELKGRVYDLTRQNWLLKKETDALLKVNVELDGRVSGQQETITSLHAQLRKLDTLDLNQALDALLETVEIFTRAVRASVWRYDDSSKSLRLAASRGWDPDESIQTLIPVDGTIEGWVYRNNSPFSVRMVLQYDNLQKMDVGRNIITIPLSFERNKWGILNIQEMPFEKYNLYSERILQIIASLAEHPIERAVAYESIIRKEEVDSKTGLPLFSQFYRTLEEETRRTDVQKGNFSLILIELTNFAEIQEKHGLDNAKRLVRSMIDALQIICDRNANCFQYKSDAQVAIIIPNLDFDGASLYSLDALEKINAEDWEVGGGVVRLEAVIGFAVSAGEGESPDQVLEQAESLLEMQKA
jgi:GGDEF domain-containing protein